jgi:EAL domain-containing protein (putative c-di-GMP-specific phosphodiesterase class I)
MRWNDEHLGPVSPSVFIPVAEESGLLAELGAWTLHNACDHVASSDKNKGCQIVHD